MKTGTLRMMFSCIRFFIGAILKEGVGHLQTHPCFFRYFSGEFVRISIALFAVGGKMAVNLGNVAFLGFLRDLHRFETCSAHHFDDHNPFPGSAVLYLNATQNRNRSDP